MAHFNRALDLDSAHFRAMAYKAMVLARQDRIEEAVAAYRACIALEPTYPKAYNNLGELQRRQGHLAEAAEAFQRALSIDEKPQYLYNIGITRVEMGDLEGAEQALGRAFELAPGDFDTATELATVQFNLKKLAAARRTLEGFLKKKPDHPRARETQTRLKAIARQAEQSSP
jgi:tetratricopeptide (TPR) repeat protein